MDEFFRKYKPDFALHPFGVTVYDFYDFIVFILIMLPIMYHIILRIEKWLGRFSYYRALYMALSKENILNFCFAVVRFLIKYFTFKNFYYIISQIKLFIKNPYNYIKTFPFSKFTPFFKKLYSMYRIVRFEFLYFFLWCRRRLRDAVLYILKSPNWCYLRIRKF